MPDIGSGISIIWSGVAAAVIVATGALTAARISQQMKISEFRQKWIDALRDDIADYLRSADKWFDTYQDINTTLDQDAKAQKVTAADEERYTTLKLLRRIQLRINPLDNPDKQEDKAFLTNLAALINPGATPPDAFGDRSRTAWNESVDLVLLQSRAILKREWQVTKHPWWGLKRKLIWKAEKTGTWRRSAQAFRRFTNGPVWAQIQKLWT